MKKLTPPQKSEKMRKRCVTLAKKIVCLKQGEKCEYCGRTKKQGWRMHGSHIYPEGVYKSMSASTKNIHCLCARCHIGGFWKNANTPSWHEDPVTFIDFFKKKYPARYEELKQRSQKSIQLSIEYWEKKLIELKKEYENIVK